MSSFFAINIDSFPWNGNGRIPLDYVLKYLCKNLSLSCLIFHHIRGLLLQTNLTIVGISSGISIPFIIVAFNQDRIARLIVIYGKMMVVWWIGLVFLIAILLPLIWTVDLARGIKAAVTITIILCIIAAVVARLLYWFVNSVRSIGISDWGSTGSS